MMIAHAAIRSCLTALLASALSFAWVSDAVAQTVDRTLLPGIVGDDQRVPLEPTEYPWTSLGRVNRSGLGHCTGALIHPRFVLTAAHCINLAVRDRWAQPSELHFVAGYQRGEFLAHSVSNAVVVASDYVREGAEANTFHDWAILELAQPITDLEPVPVMAVSYGELVVASEAGTLSRAGYSMDRAHLLSIHAGCRMVGELGGGRLLLHDCDSTRGDSGSPILMATDDGFVIVGISVGVLSENDGGWGLAIPAVSFVQTVGHLILEGELPTGNATRTRAQPGDVRALHDHR